jgi:hypothetical protein
MIQVKNKYLYFIINILYNNKVIKIIHTKINLINYHNQHHYFIYKI